MEDELQMSIYDEDLEPDYEEMSTADRDPEAELDAMEDRDEP